MINICIAIQAKDRKVGAMVKALAFDVNGPKAVVGASREFLDRNGYLVFHFRSEKQATEFIDSIAVYLPGDRATVSNT